MRCLRRVAAFIYAYLTHLYPQEFRRRYGAEMRLDFDDVASGCASPTELVVATSRACGDLLTSSWRRWLESGMPETLACAIAAHCGMWLIAVLVASRQWPGAPSVVALVLQLAIIAAAGVAATVWMQRRPPSDRHINLNARL